MQSRFLRLVESFGMYSEGSERTIGLVEEYKAMERTTLSDLRAQRAFTVSDTSITLQQQINNPIFHYVWLH